MQPEYLPQDPTPEEFEQRKAAIQAEWTEEQELRRRAGGIHPDAPRAKQTTRLRMKLPHRQLFERP